jgi:hypothetical protein
MITGYRNEVVNHHGISTFAYFIFAGVVGIDGCTGNPKSWLFLKYSTIRSAFYQIGCGDTHRK